MNRRIQHLAFGLVLFGALLVRLYHINGASYWIDEMTSVHIAKSPFLTSVFWDNCPFLYHFLLKIWIFALGDSEFATRGLSVIFSLATTAVLMFYCDRRFGFFTGIVASLLHAVYPLSVAYAQETRMYALFEFCATFNLIYFLEYRAGRAQARGYIISVILLSLSHYLAIVPLFVQFALLAKGKTKETAVKAGSLTIAVLGISYLIYFSWPHLEWQRLKFMVEPQTGHLTEVLRDLFFGSWAAAIALVSIFGVWFALQKNRKDAVLALRVFAATLILLCASAYIFQRSVFHSRYFIFLAPYIVMAVSIMIVKNLRAGRNFAGGAAFALFLIVVVALIEDFDGDFRAVKAPWRAIVKQIAKDPTAMVFTTRTLSIRSPYFERENIPVDSITSPNQVGEMAEMVAMGATVWIVDAYWASITYVPTMVDAIKAKGLEAEEFVFKTGKSDVIVAVRVTSAGS